MVFGNMYTFKIVILNTKTATQNIDDIVSTEKLLKITPTQDVFILLTPKSSTTLANQAHYLLKANVEVEFLVGRGLDRITLYNISGSTANVHVAIMY